MSSQATPGFSWDWPGEHLGAQGQYNAVDATNAGIVAEGYDEVKQCFRDGGGFSPGFSAASRRLFFDTQQFGQQVRKFQTAEECAPTLAGEG